jgi:serine/threonine protein kinase
MSWNETDENNTTLEDLTTYTPLTSLEGAFGWKAPEMIYAASTVEEGKGGSGGGGGEGLKGYGMSVDWWGVGVVLMSLANRLVPFRNDREVIRYAKASSAAGVWDIDDSPTPSPIPKKIKSKVSQ